MIVGLQKERRKRARDDSAEEKLAARLVWKHEALRRDPKTDNKEDQKDDVPAEEFTRVPDQPRDMRNGQSSDN